MLHTQKENLNNGERDLFFFIFYFYGGPRGLILEHFWYNSEPLRYLWFLEMLMKYGGMLFRDFF